MKDIKEVNIKDLKEAVKELNESGLIKKKIKLVGISNINLLKEFTESIEAVTEQDENIDIPQGIADFYNDLYADEIDLEDNDSDSGDDTSDEEGAEDDDNAENPEDEGAEDTETPEDEESSDEETEGDAPDEDNSEDVTEDEGGSDETDTPATVKADKKEKKKPVVRDKPEPKKKSLGVDRRAKVNPKLSLVKKVTNLLNFGDQRYKQTTYFPLDCETIRVLETNVGLFPAEILAQMKADKKVAKKVEKYSPGIISREINKIKSAYCYIVGAIDEGKADSKFRNIMTSLLAGKDIPADVAHYSTVKVARRALLAYMDVVGIDYSVMKDVRKELVKKASEKKEKPAEKVAPKPEPKPTPKPAPKKEASKPAPKPESKPAPKKSPKKK